MINVSFFEHIARNRTINVMMSGSPPSVLGIFTSDASTVRLHPVPDVTTVVFASRE